MLLSKSKVKQIVGIYVIKFENYVYIGESLDVYNRWEQHQEDLSNNVHANAKLQYLYNQGADFSFRILDGCDFVDGHNLYFKLLNLNREKRYIQSFKANHYEVLNTEDSVQRLKSIPSLNALYEVFLEKNIDSYDEIVFAPIEDDHSWDEFKSLFYQQHAGMHPLDKW